MRILITGGAGFQGSHLVERCLNAGHQVTILNTYSEEAIRNTGQRDKDVSVVWGSITDSEIVEKTVRGQELVVHMAARINVDESIEAPGTFLAANVMGTYNVLEAVRRQECRLVYSSTCEVYGAHHGAVTETSDLRPNSPYAASKAAADRLCFAYNQTYGVDVVIVRPSNVYGVRQKSGKGGAVIPIFVEKALGHIPLTVFGTGEQRRQYIHVEDLVRGYELVIGRTDLQGEVINFGTADTPSIKEIAEFISQQLDTSVEYVPARLGEVPGFKLDSSKAAQMGFSPNVSFWDGLGSYIEWRKSTQRSGI